MNISSCNSGSSPLIIATPDSKTYKSECIEAGSRFAEYGRVDLTQQGSLTRVDVYQRQGFQVEYTKEDALLNVWKSEHHKFRLDDPSSWQKIAVAPTQEELDTLLYQLKSNGLNGEVDWNGFSNELDSLKTVNSSDLTGTIDYISSRYVAILDKLERNFSGDELLTQKDHLQAIYEEGVTNFAEEYTKKINTTLGLSISETKKIQDSLQSILDQKINAYQSTLACTTQLSDDADTWLQNHDAYMAAQLRQTEATVGQHSEETETGLYTIQDLTAVGKVAEGYEEEINNATNGNRNEVTLALNMAMIDMKVEKLAQNGCISDEMAQLLQNSREAAQHIALDAADEKLESRRSNSLSGEVTKSFLSMDRGMFSNIYQKIMDTYNNTQGDATQAIYLGAKYGKTLTSEANIQNSTVTRWGVSMQSYWDNFYKIKPDSRLQKTVDEMFGLTSKSISTFQNYSDSWQHFITTLSSNQNNWYMGAEGSFVPNYGLDSIWMDIDA